MHQPESAKKKSLEELKKELEMDDHSLSVDEVVAKYNTSLKTVKPLHISFSLFLGWVFFWLFFLCVCFHSSVVAQRWLNG